MEGTVLKTSFPNTIYLVVYHGGVDQGEFSFDFWYLDQDTNEAKETIVDGYTIELEEIRGKSNRYG